MPQMEVVPFNNPGNEVILDEIRAEMVPDLQRYIPAATIAGLEKTMDALWQYTPALNQVVDSLVNKIGAQIIKNITWTNPLAKFKRGLLSRGETIEEVYVGLLKPKTYNWNAEYLEKDLFGRKAPNVQTAYHSINRQEYFELTIPEASLERAMLTPNGLGNLVNDMMQSIGTSDQKAEFLESVSVLKRYYDRDGFHTIKVPDISRSGSDANDAKQFLRTVRSLAQTLTFPSTLFNARHVEMVSRPEELELILTPEGAAAIDVEALSAAFNEDKATMPFRVTIIPAHYIDIPGFQGILTTRAWWIIADNIMRMGQTNNPLGMYSNHFWHHQETISASPFENAVLLSSTEESTIVVTDYLPTLIREFIITDIVDDDNPNVPVTNNAATVERGGAYVVKTAAQQVTQTGDVAPDGAVVLTLAGNSSLKTRINQHGVLIIGYDEANTTINVHVRAFNDSTVDRNLALTVTGPKVYGSIGLDIDENPGAIANTKLPYITPGDGGPVGTVLSANRGSWDTDDIDLSIQWTRDGANIAGATGDQYPTVTADGTHTIAIKVTSAKTGLTGSTAVSKGVLITPAV